MTIATLDAEIALAQDEFRALNREHWFWPIGGDKQTYRRLSDATERHIVELADRMARLHRFRSELFARNYASDSA